MRKLLDWFISAITRWADRELEAAKRDPDVSYAEYKDMQKMVADMKAEAPQEKGIP
jgi:hypothetical protein